MNSKYKTSALLIGLLALPLVGCNQDNPTPSEESVVPPSSSRGDVYIETTVSRTTIPSGGNFFDFCKPSVIFHDKDEAPEDVTNYTFQTTYKIKNKADTSKKYDAGDPLPAGEYVAEIAYRTRNRDTVNFTVEDVTPTTGSEGHGYKTYTVEDIAPYTYKNYSQIDTLSGGNTPSKGNTKILVIPVQFLNAQFDNPETEQDEGQLARSIMNEAFFGNTEDTPWESLASYYKKASFGAQQISGEVTPIYTYNHNDTDKNLPQLLAQSICNEAVNYFKQNGTINAQEYDSDHDGYIDGVEIVYATTQLTPSASGNDGTQDTWWNYCTNTSSAPNVSSPTPHRMFWSRYDFLTQKYYADSEKGLADTNGNKVDPHTIIHETGHMMGAPDYYSYAHDEGPAGCVDMMDCNVGDHNAYTKMHYNWVAPMVIDGSADNFTVTLHSFGETGEFILLRNTTEKPWNKTPFDEYLVLQYYTPTKLNEMDSNGYGEWKDSQAQGGGSAYGHAGTYAHPGLQVFHADGRVVSQMGEIVNGQKSKAEYRYTDDPHNAAYEGDGVYGSAATRTHANTGNAGEAGRASQTVVDGELTSDTKIRELSIILPSGTNSFSSSSYYNNMGYMTNLFGLNGVELNGWTGDATKTSGEDKFGGSFYSNYKMSNFYPNSLKFNDGTTLNWAFEVVAQDAESITIHFLNSAA